MGLELGAVLSLLPTALPDMSQSDSEAEALLREIEAGASDVSGVVPLPAAIPDALAASGEVPNAPGTGMGRLQPALPPHIVADAPTDGSAASDLITALLEDAGKENLAAQQQIYLGTASRILPDTLASTDLIDLSMLTRADVGKKVHDSWHLIAFHGDRFFLKCYL